jgi:hypothetical protein
MKIKRQVDFAKSVAEIRSTCKPARVSLILAKFMDKKYPIEEN